MYVTIPAEEVGAKIVEWYSCIIARSVDQAVLLHTEIKEMLKRMEPSDRMLAYYSLVEYRFTLMRDQTTDETTGDKMLEHVGITVEKSIDHMLHYLYYFVSGQHEFSHERYRSAVKLFRKAERLLEYVNDEAEEAEFHYFMGVSLHQINQYVFAASYLEDAILIFEKLHYKERTITCYTILAAIFSETGNFERADELLKSNLKQAANFSFSRLAIIRMLGINSFRKKDYNSAIHYYDVVLNDNEYGDKLIGVKAKYSLARTLYSIGDINNVRRLVEEAKTGATYFENQEYILRCKILEALMTKEINTIRLNQLLNKLKSLNLYYATEELAEELSVLFKEKGSHIIAYDFLKEAYQAKQLNISLGVE